MTTEFTPEFIAGELAKMSETCLPMIQVSQTDFENKYVSRISYDALRARAEAAEAKVSELEAAQAWVLVSERLPENFQEVLVLVGVKHTPFK